MFSHDSSSSGAAGANRILAAAIELFGESGVNGASLKAIAARAEVSQALIVHHFGSKDGLRVACDEQVARLVRTAKVETMAQGPQLSPLSALAAIEEHRPAMRYLARTLTDGSPHVNDLLDEMLADAEAYTDQGVEAGMIRPSVDAKARVAVLMLMSLGVLVLHEHLRRFLGEDLLGGDGPPVRYLRAVLEVYSEGVLADGAYEQLREYLVDPRDKDEEST